MRSFIAIPLPEEIKELLASIQNKLKASGADVKWVEPKNIHLTLKFLGEIDQAQLEKITLIMEEAAGKFSVSKAELNCIGAFPRATSARVVWAGIDKGDGFIKEVASFLEERIEATGIPKEERAFSSHITLGRTRSGTGLDKLAKALQDMAELKQEEKRSFTVGKITLYKSTLSPRGPVYEPLKEVSLKTS